MQKNSARTGSNGTGAKDQNGMPGKGMDFPHTIPEGFNLNELSAEEGDPPPITAKDKRKGAQAAQPLIKQIARYLSGRYAFRYNLLKNTIEFKSRDAEHWAELDERRAKRLEGELLRAGFRGVKSTLETWFAEADDFDPVQRYLDGLPAWDGRTDHITRLASFVNVPAKRRDWFDLMFKKHLVRTVACAVGALGFNKHCFTLVSGQNDGKTSFLRFLCPEAWKEYYSEEIDFENKDGLIALARNLFINLDELRNLSRQDINKVKSYLSKDHIKARLPFDRRETKLRRRASFWGSTNNAEFLTDETGNVRWLVFEIYGVHHDNGGPNGYAGAVNINDVYAQAYALLRSGFQYQLTREEIEQSEQINRGHLNKPAELELLLTHFEESTAPADFKTATQIQHRLQAITGAKLSPVHIGRAARMMGLKAIRKKVNGMPVPGYLLKEIAERNWAAEADAEPD